MNIDRKRNVSAASLHQRLLNEARRIGVSHDLLMRRYVFERFLFRLGQSSFRDQLVLKGAMALVGVTKNFIRPSRDMDMLGLVRLTSKQALDAVKTIAATVPNPTDPVAFNIESLQVAVINAAHEEPGHQITGEAKLGNARIPLKIEISHGQIVSPAPLRMQYPTVLDGMTAPDILCYTPESMLAEKFEAIVSLGIGNSRFKDFYDVREISRRLDFDGAEAAAAFRATFSQRGTPMPTESPEPFTAAFFDSGERGWRAFVAKLPARDDQSFTAMIAEIEPFVMRICAMAHGSEHADNWKAGAGWIETPKPGPAG